MWRTGQGLRHDTRARWPLVRCPTGNRKRGETRGGGLIGGRPRSGKTGVRAMARRTDPSSVPRRPFIFPRSSCGERIRSRLALVADHLADGVTVINYPFSKRNRTLPQIDAHRPWRVKFSLRR